MNIVRLLENTTRVFIIVSQKIGGRISIFDGSNVEGKSNKKLLAIISTFKKESRVVNEYSSIT